MSDTSDTSPADPTDGIDDLFTSIRAALTPDAPTDTRSAGANACRTILGVLAPPATPNDSAVPPLPPLPPLPSLPSLPFGPQLSNALGAIGSIPREQVLQFLVGGLRSMLGQTAPTYHTRPVPAPPRPSGSGGEP